MSLKKSTFKWGARLSIYRSGDAIFHHSMIFQIFCCLVVLIWCYIHLCSWNYWSSMILWLCLTWIFGWYYGGRFWGQWYFYIKITNFTFGNYSTLTSIATRKWSNRACRAWAACATYIFTPNGTSIDGNLFQREKSMKKTLKCKFKI